MKLNGNIELIGPFKVPRHRFDVVDMCALIAVAVIVATLTAVYYTVSP